jgi:hypothetical protein
LRSIFKRIFEVEQAKNSFGDIPVWLLKARWKVAWELNPDSRAIARIVR